MEQRILDIIFFASVVVLSYIASVHLVTNRVVEKLQAANQQQERQTNQERSPVLSGPVQLRPIPKHHPLVKAVVLKPKPVKRERLPERKLALKHTKKHKKSR